MIRTHKRYLNHGEYAMAFDPTFRQVMIGRISVSRCGKWRHIHANRAYIKEDDGVKELGQSMFTLKTNRPCKPLVLFKLDESEFLEYVVADQL